MKKIEQFISKIIYQLEKKLGFKNSLNYSQDMMLAFEVSGICKKSIVTENLSDNREHYFYKEKEKSDISDDKDNLKNNGVSSLLDYDSDITENILDEDILEMELESYVDYDHEDDYNIDEIDNDDEYEEVLSFEQIELIKKINEKKEINDANKKEKKFFDKSPLPSLYFVDEIVLMPKNITTLFTYWEVKEETFNKLKKEYDVFDNPIVKIYDEYGNEIQKIQEWTRVGQRYILNLQENSKYYAVIGYEDIYGNFYTVAQSKESITPRSKESDNNYLTWGTMNFHQSSGGSLLKKQDKYLLIPDNIEFLDLIVKTSRLENMYDEALVNAIKQMIGYNYADNQFINDSVVQAKVYGNDFSDNESEKYTFANHVNSSNSKDLFDRSNSTFNGSSGKFGSSTNSLNSLFNYFTNNKVYKGN